MEPLSSVVSGSVCAVNLPLSLLCWDLQLGEQFPTTSPPGNRSVCAGGETAEWLDGVVSRGTTGGLSQTPNDVAKSLFWLAQGSRAVNRGPASVLCDSADGENSKSVKSA